MVTLLASSPLVVVLLGMTVLRRSAALAGAAGLGVALALWLTAFRGTGVPGQGFAGAGAEAMHSTGTILWIILPALALYEFQERTGAIGRIRDALAGLTAERRLQAILIAWFFGLFVEGAAGFGTPVALAAPLLVGIGYGPVRAVVLALLGHAAGVSFGAVGTPTLAQLQISGLDPRELAGTVAGLHLLLGPILLLMMVRLADDRPLARGDLGWSALAAVAFLVPSVALAWLVGPELPSLAGALIGVGLFVAVLLRRQGGRAPDLRALLPDLAPYLAIVALILLTRLVPPLREMLASVTLDWSIHDTFSGGFAPLFHPGTLLALGLAGAAWRTGRAGYLGPSAAAALRRAVPVAVALVVMLGLSRTMVHSGMIATLAEAAARTDAAWPLLAPSIGVLGTFITGSATTSNILFTDLQLTTAGALALPPTIMAAAQGVGSAVGNIVAPHNIIAGSATVGLVGREGEILRQTILPCLLHVALAGVLVLGLSAIA